MVNLNERLTGTRPHAFFCAACGRALYDLNEIDERTCTVCSAWADEVASRNTPHARYLRHLDSLVRAYKVRTEFPKRSKLGNQIQKSLREGTGPALPTDPFKGFRS